MNEEVLQLLEEPEEETLVLIEEKIEQLSYFTPYFSKFETTEDEIKLILIYCQENPDYKNPFVLYPKYAQKTMYLLASLNTREIVPF